MIVAIDGPAAAGKGTLAKLLAEHYALPYLDTGLLYRLVGRTMARRHLDLDDAAAAEQVAAAIDPGDLTKAARLAHHKRLTLIERDVADVLPGIDLHIARDTHTFASIWVEIRNDGKQPSQDNWVVAGDLVYSYDNIGGIADGESSGEPYHPIGIAIGSQANLLMTTETMLQAVGYRRRRIIPVHEERVMRLFPSRTLAPGLSITEIRLADGVKSRLD